MKKTIRQVLKYFLKSKPLKLTMKVTIDERNEVMKILDNRSYMRAVNPKKPGLERKSYIMIDQGFEIELIPSKKVIKNGAIEYIPLK